MSEQDNHIDDLFKKAKKAPPIVSLSEVKDLLKHQKVGGYRPSRRWIYFSLSSVVFVSLLTFFVSNNRSITDSRVVENIVVASPTMPETIQDKPEKKVVSKNEFNSVVPPKVENIQQTVKSAPASTPAEKDILVKVINDSVKTDQNLNRTKEPVPRYILEESEIIIPWFANGETIKTYQDRLLKSGIELKIIDIVYNGKDLGREYITELKADILIHDTLYKSIQLKDFKELRISWATYSTGEVRIKSVKMLDKNYMSRKL